MPNSYRDLVVWQRAVDLSVVIYQLTGEFPRQEIYGITSQMRRAAVLSRVISPKATDAALSPTYHTTHGCSGIIGCPFLQPNASPNLSKFCTEPFVLKRPGE